MKTILFQGDSITDCGRYRKAKNETDSSVAPFRDGKPFKKITALGEGYPAMVTAELQKAQPGEFTYVNKGVSGDRIPDVYARIVSDIIKVKPDYMSLLIGVNDVWRNFDSDGTGTGALRFEKVYDILLSELKEEFPQLKVIIMGAFVIEGSATRSKPDQPDRYESFRSQVAEMADISKKLAEKYGCAYIDLQAAFDEAVKTVPAATLSGDGVHPTRKGHELITKEWLTAFKKFEV